MIKKTNKQHVPVLENQGERVHYIHHDSSDLQQLQALQNNLVEPHDQVLGNFGLCLPSLNSTFR